MSYLALAKKIQAEIAPSGASDAGAPPAEAVIDGTTVAVLIESEILGAPIWFAFKDGWTPNETDGVPIFYASELSALREKTLEQLRSIFNVKRSFSGGMVRQ